MGAIIPRAESVEAAVDVARDAFRLLPAQDAPQCRDGVYLRATAGVAVCVPHSGPQARAKAIKRLQRDGWREEYRGDVRTLLAWGTLTDIETLLACAYCEPAERADTFLDAVQRLRDMPIGTVVDARELGRTAPLATAIDAAATGAARTVGALVDPADVAGAAALYPKTVAAEERAWRASERAIKPEETGLRVSTEGERVYVHWRGEKLRVGEDIYSALTRTARGLPPHLASVDFEELAAEVYPAMSATDAIATLERAIDRGARRVMPRRKQRKDAGVKRGTVAERLLARATVREDVFA